jgi:hypothetical protein
MLSKTVYVGFMGKQWAFWKEDARRVSKLFCSRADAIKYGRAIARRDGVRLSIHGKDGMPQSSYEPAKLAHR